jgi:hypothetical protein
MPHTITTFPPTGDNLGSFHNRAIDDRVYAGAGALLSYSNA